MLEFTLPLVSPETTLQQAIDIMEERGTSAIVVNRASGPAVLDADAILQALHDRNAANQSRNIKEDIIVSKIIPRARAKQIKPQLTEAVSFGLPNARDLQAEFDKNSAYFLILEMTGKEAKVISWHENIGGALTVRLKVCRCKSQPRQHVFRQSQLVKPGECNFDGDKVKCS